MPFWLADRLHTDFIPDYDHYCQNFTLQNILEIAGFKNVAVSNFAIDGEMASDAFLIHKKLLEKDCYPEWIIYGIAPRDFIDSLLSKEIKTPIFNSLFSLTDIWSENNGFVLNLNERLNLTLEKLLFLFDKRKQIQNTLTNFYYDLLCRVFVLKKVNDKTEEMPQALTLEHDIHKNACQDTYLWNSSIREYKKRYRIFKYNQLKKQELFLRNLCKNAADNDCKVLLINMPLTKDNLALMPNGAYAQYCAAIKRATQLKDVYLLDLQGHKDFRKELYRDSAHLNEKGAHLLSMLISETLQKITASQASQFQLDFKSDIRSQLAKREKIIKDNKVKTEDGIASWWLAKAYFANSTPPDIAVLGSAQLGPILGTDAYVYKKLVDVTRNHRSQVLEHDFYGLLNKKWNVFVGALPNAMISDQFIMSQALFSKQYKPKLAMLTFSPRDFIDSYYSDSNKTEAYAFFSKYLDRNLNKNGNGAPMLRKSLKNKCEFYDDPQNADGKYLTGVSPLTLGKPFERLCPGELIINSIDGCVARNNTEEYKTRYKYPLSSQFYTQLHYFNCLLEYLAKQNIQVVALNMPLRGDNKKLLGNNFWKIYDNQISETCRKNGADYINIDRVVLPFKDNEFIDGVHLNSIGGLRLSRTMALFIANKFHTKTFEELLARDKYLK